MSLTDEGDLDAGDTGEVAVPREHGDVPDHRGGGDERIERTRPDASPPRRHHELTVGTCDRAIYGYSFETVLDLAQEGEPRCALIERICDEGTQPQLGERDD